MNDILILAGCVLVVVLLGGIEFVQHSRTCRKIDEQHAAMRRLQQDVHALCVGALNLGRHIDALEQRIRRLAERQDQLEMRDPMEQSYAHAIRLAQKGVNVNDLVENCGLARAEAELLLRVHRAQQQEVVTV